MKKQDHIDEGASPLEIWQGRYPNISFFLSLFPYEKKELKKDLRQFITWLSKQNLSEIEILYVVGLIDFTLPDAIFTWMDEKRERALIFIEDDLGAFASFTQVSLINHPQIHFHYANENPIEELAHTFPVDRLAIFEGKTFDGLQLKRRSAALSAIYSDVLYSHKIVENVLTNFLRLPQCFNATQGSFENIPVVICGAGPSLENAIADLKQAYDKCLIIACGSAIASLTKLGIVPHIGIALDPNPEEEERLKQASFPEGIFLFAPRLNHRVFATLGGPFGYLKTDTGGTIEAYLEKELGITGDSVGSNLSSEAFSVTTLALNYAYKLGCNPILFAGVDLAFTGGKRYAGGVHAEESKPKDPRALEETLIRTDINGKQVGTLLKWVMEADEIGRFAKNHPEITILNATEGGIGFTGIKNTSVGKALKNAPPLDIFGKLKRWVQNSPFQIDELKLTDVISKLHQSLLRCKTLNENILQELEAKKENSARLFLYRSDLEEEIAFIALLYGIDAALERILTRYFPHIDPHVRKWERERAKSLELNEQIDRFLEVFNAVLKQGSAMCS